MAASMCLAASTLPCCRSTFIAAASCMVRSINATRSSSRWSSSSLRLAGEWDILRLLGALPRQGYLADRLRQLVRLRHRQLGQPGDVDAQGILDALDPTLRGVDPDRCEVPGQD